MELPGSILDRVISSKKSTEIEQFNPAEVASLLLKNLSSREEDVLRRRYGLTGKDKETLEEIGATYKVTRERVRQIENTAISKIKKNKIFHDTVTVIESTVTSVLEQHGGIMTEKQLLEELLQVVGDTVMNRQNIVFIISQLLNLKFKSLKPTAEFRQSWYIAHAPLHLVKETIDSVLTIIQQHGKPMTTGDILNKFTVAPLYQTNRELLSDDATLSYIRTSEKISQNPFGEYGLTEWGSIVPKRMNDKIYLVLKKNGKPMHFTEITKKINETKFDDREAYPPTVHNELILNDQYVLVGRGIYALHEWGFQPGVVANVIASILTQEKRPMRREEIVDRVSKQRIVKKNTIHLALTDKSKFTKNQDGTYTVAESANA